MKLNTFRYQALDPCAWYEFLGKELDVWGYEVPPKLNNLNFLPLLREIKFSSLQGSTYISLKKKI